MKNRDNDNFIYWHLQEAVDKSLKIKKWAEVETSARFNPYLMKMLSQFDFFLGSKNNFKNQIQLQISGFAGFTGKWSGSTERITSTAVILLNNIEK